MQSPNFPITPSLSTLAHMPVVESTLTRVVKPRAHRHLVPYLPSVQLYRSSAAFHTGWCTEVTLICPQLLLLSAPCALFSGPKLSQPLHAPPLWTMAVRLEWITVSFLPSPNHMVPSLSLTLSLWTATPPISSPSPV